MKIVFLGTGGSWPSKERNVTSVAVKLDGEVLLFDCGEGTQRQMMSSEISFMDVNHIFISHFHGDHFLGIPGLIQTMTLNRRKKDLNVYGPEGTRRNITMLLSSGYFNLNFPIEVTDLMPGDEVRISRFRVLALPADHSVPSLAYVIQEDDRPGKFDLTKARALGIPEGPLYRRLQMGQSVEVNGRVITSDMVLGPPRTGRKIVYSGDTRPSQEIENASRNADVLIHEATLSADLQEKADDYAHTTAKDAAEIAKRAGVRCLFLIHISPRYKDVSKLLEEAKSVFQEVIVPDDLSVYDVPYHD